MRNLERIVVGIHVIEHGRYGIGGQLFEFDPRSTRLLFFEIVLEEPHEVLALFGPHGQNCLVNVILAVQLRFSSAFSRNANFDDPIRVALVRVNAPAETVIVFLLLLVIGGGRRGRILSFTTTVSGIGCVAAHIASSTLV